jgi:UDPglucose 6-dehydrogenase
MSSVSVIGLGKLGLPLAASLANKGYRVIGVDLNPKVIQAVNEGKSPYFEPGLSELIKSAGGNLTATDDYPLAIQNSEISFIVVLTPSEPDGSFSTKYVKSVIEKMGAELKQKHNFHLIVLTSTVLPGDTQNVIINALEKETGKKCGRDFGVCYSPEFIALGSVIRDFTNPDVVLIGESDTKSGDILSDIYHNVCQNNPPIVRTGIQNAELAKISLNAYVTMKITFANTLAEIAEKIPGGDADSISQLLGFDTRIGRKYLSGGLAFGGPCFPRDNKAFASIAKRLGGKATLASATDTANQEQVKRVVLLIEKTLGSTKGKKIAILGLTYKPNTDVVEESAAAKIALELIRQEAHVNVYDPAGMENAKKIIGYKNVTYSASISECLKDTGFCVLATPWNDFKSLKPEDFISAMKNAILLDCWRLFNRKDFGKQIKYLAIGINDPTQAGQS